MREPKLQLIDISRRAVNSRGDEFESMLRRYPAADPDRCAISGQTIAPHVLDERPIFSFPRVVFQSIPIIATKRKRTYALSPSTTMFEQAMIGPAHFVGCAGAVVYKVLRSIEHVTSVFDNAVQMDRPDWSDLAPSLLDPDACWPSKISHGAGSASPTMIYRGQRMLVAEALFNVAYPSLLPIRFRTESSYKFHRWCRNKNCVNPLHYMKGQVLTLDMLPMAVSNTIMLPPSVETNKIQIQPPPLPAFDPVTKTFAYARSWTEWSEHTRIVLGYHPLAKPAPELTEAELDPAPEALLGELLSSDEGEF